MSIEKQIASAAELGKDYAENAASWATDGNTTAEHASRVLAMLDDGDPLADEYLPESPNLSGEWAHGLTPTRLYVEITGEDYATAYDEAGLAAETLVGSRMDAICEAYEQAVADHFVPACERALRSVGGQS